MGGGRISWRRGLGGRECGGGGLPGRDSGTREGGTACSSLLLTRSILTARQIAKWKPQSVHVASPPQRERSLFNSHLVPPQTSAGRSAKEKNVHNPRGLWVTGKSRTNSPHWKKLGHKRLRNKLDRPPDSGRDRRMEACWRLHHHRGPECDPNPAWPLDG